MVRLNQLRASKSMTKRQRIRERRERIKELKHHGAKINNFRNDGSFLSQFLNYQNEQSLPLHVENPTGHAQKQVESVESKEIISSIQQNELAHEHMIKECQFREAAEASQSGLTAEQAETKIEETAKQSDSEIPEEKRVTVATKKVGIQVVDEDIF